MSCSTLATIGFYFIILSSILFVVISGVGYGYMNNDILFSSGAINFRILYGCGIGISLIFFIVIWPYFTNPSFCCHFVLTIPVCLVMFILYLNYSLNSSANKYVKNLGTKWDNSSQIIEYQYKHSCCGWLSVNDRGLSYCPFDFESGCKSKVENYITGRFKEIMKCTILILTLFVIGVISSTLFTCVEDEENVYEYVFPFDI